MRITFKETRRLSEDGFTVRRFEAGQTYEVADSAARAAIRNGWAFEPEQPPPSPGESLLDCFQSRDPSDQLASLNSFLAEHVVDSAMIQLGRKRYEHARPTNPATLIATDKLGA